MIDAEPEATSEYLSCNLLPVERLPIFVYTAPIAKSLTTPRTDGSFGLPSKEMVKQAIRAHQEAAGRKPFTPTFRLLGNLIVTFHDLEAQETVFAPVIERPWNALC